MPRRRNDPRAEEHEHAQLERDRRDQERAAGHPPVARYALDWLHAVHPDTGNEVVFKAGELLPGWAVEPHEDQAEDEL